MLTTLPRLSETTSQADGATENPAPRLLAAGVDVTQVARGTLPLLVWQGIETVCLQYRKEPIRWQLACLLTESCRQQLDRGIAEADVVAWLQSRPVRKLLAANEELRRIACELSLPAPICERVLWVYRRLGWWIPGRITFRERVDGCVNLCVELESQLSAGKRIEEILVNSKSAMYREVRRKKLQQRWLISRVFRRLRQIVAIIVFVSFTIWGLLFFRLITTKPGETRSIFLLVNKVVSETSPADRAWPLLREAHVTAGVQNYNTLPEAITSFTNGPTDPNWESSNQLIGFRADAISLAVEGSKKSVMGFKYFDGADSALSTGIGSWTSLKTDWVDMPMYQSTTYSTLDQLLQAAQLKAIHDKKHQVAFELLSARIRIKALIASSVDMQNMTQFGRRSGYSVALEIPEFLQDHGSTVTRETLAELEQAVLQLETASAPRWSGYLADRLEETIDTYFMPGENGTITYDGLEMLRKIATGKPELAAMTAWLGNPQPVFAPIYVPPTDRTFVAGPLVSLVVMNRTELERILGLGSSTTLSGAEKDAKLIEQLEKLDTNDYLASDYQAIHHSPLFLLIYQYRSLKDLYVKSSSGYSSNEISQLRAIQLACAIERFHLRTETFPETLDLLLGAELKTLPVDPVTEQPLKYRRFEKRYVIYSVGLDLVDQTADEKREPTEGRAVNELDLHMLSRKFTSAPAKPVEQPQN